ncbi:MAG TPA: 30S ribosomal protein S9, partial [Firmicutes bacterium]|nr:30S ribosomal protein S9 [Bacillota bacterium]
MATKKKETVTYYGTGRRKSSVARVFMTSGTGKITVNGHPVAEYMPYDTLVMDLMQPLVLTNNADKFDV